MKITYCGIFPTKIKIFQNGDDVEVKLGQEIDMEESQALKLLNGYGNLFCQSINKKEVERLTKVNKDEEAARQIQIDKEIEEKLVKEENDKKEQVALLEKKSVEKEVAQKQAIKKQEEEIANIQRAEKLAKTRKSEMEAEMKEDKDIMDKRIEKVKATLLAKK